MSQFTLQDGSSSSAFLDFRESPFSRDGESANDVFGGICCFGLLPSRFRNTEYPLRKGGYGMGTAPTVMTHSLRVAPERVVKWILAVPGASVHAVPYGSIEMTSGFELVQVP